jgi:hypothetical protein
MVHHELHQVKRFWCLTFSLTCGEWGIEGGSGNLPLAYRPESKRFSQRSKFLRSLVLAPEPSEHI